MAIVEWSSDLSVGISKIDGQHLKLIEMMQQLHEAIREDQAADLIEDTIVNLFNYAQIHFATEEKLFRQHQYPEEKLHELEHAKFITKAFEFREKFDAKRPGLNLELLNFLSSWILNHIEITDKRYTKHLNRCGVI
ncbi:MAG TPA: bacteriohemerythrin [Geomonas sp.]